MLGNRIPPSVITNPVFLGKAVYSVNTQVNLSRCSVLRAARALGMQWDIFVSKFGLRRTDLLLIQKRNRTLRESPPRGSGEALKACIVSKHSLPFPSVTMCPPLSRKIHPETPWSPRSYSLGDVLATQFGALYKI